MKFISQLKKTYRVVKNKTGIGGRREGAWMLRPFQRNDLRTIPEGWHAGPPSFVGIASGKAGTTWWYRLLLRHPSIQPNRLSRKELHYFCHFGPSDLNAAAIETYREAFAAPDRCISGEWSTGYLTFPFAIQHLASAAPEAKLLAIIRNPVERIHSAMNHALSNRYRFMALKPDQAYVYRTFSLGPEVFFNTLLSEPFKRLLKFFDRKQVLVLQYEKCKMDPDNEIRRTYQFLGIDDSFIPDKVERKINVQPAVLPPLREEQRKEIAEFFSDDVRKLIDLFPNFDLSLWPDFERLKI
jgi:sulfotransferase family protein